MNKKFGLVLGGGLLAASLLTGCNKELSAGDIRSDMTPELQSVAATSEQRKSMHARAVDTDLRQVWDDLDSIFFLDRPLHTSRYPIP